MDTPYPDLPESRIAYIREVPLERLSDELRSQFGDTRHVYGIHSEDGECLALTRNRHTAFVLARQNDLAPVSAH
ncbi:MAG: DUF1150 family protein [Pararhodobacter sp.]